MPEEVIRELASILAAAYLRYERVRVKEASPEPKTELANAPQIHPIPHLSLPPDASLATPDLPGIGRALAATRHLLEMFRRQLTNEKTRRQLQRLDQRLLNVASRLEQLGTPEK